MSPSWRFRRARLRWYCWPFSDTWPTPALLSYEGGGVQGKILDNVLRYLDWNGSGMLLDIGCGSGALTVKAAKKYPHARLRRDGLLGRRVGLYERTAPLSWIFPGVTTVVTILFRRRGRLLIILKRRLAVCLPAHQAGYPYDFKHYK